MAPDYFPAVQLLARLAEQEFDIEASKALFIKLTLTEDGSEPAALALADIAVRQGDMGGALAQLQAALNKYPESIGVRLRHLRLLIAQGRLVEAESAAETVYEMAPEMPNVLLLKADVDFRTGDTRAAQATAAQLQGLMDQYKGNPAMLATVGALQLRLGNLTLARTNLELAVAGPRPPNLALVTMARLELAEGDTRAAQRRLDQLVGRGVDSEELHLLQGDVLVASKRTEDAVAHFKQLAEQGSRAGTSRYALALSRQGDHQQAQKILADWLRQYPDDRGMRVLLANAQIQAGNEDSAKAEYEAMLPTDNPVVLNNLALIYLA